MNNGKGEYSSKSLPRVRLDAGVAGTQGNNAGVRLRCWAAPPSITEEDAEDDPDDDAASLRAIHIHGMYFITNFYMCLWCHLLLSSFSKEVYAI